MTPENFTYWLAGYLELTKSDVLDKEQVQSIKDHLGLVLKKVTPVRVTQQTSYDPYKKIC